MCAQRAPPGGPRPRPCASCGHRAAAKNFHSQKPRMRTGVLSGMFFCSLLQTVALSFFLSLLNILRKDPPPLLFFPVYLPVSLSCQLFERPCTSSCGLPAANCHRAYLPPSTLAIKRLLSQRRRKRNLACTPTLHSWAKKEL